MPITERVARPRPTPAAARNCIINSPIIKTIPIVEEINLHSQVDTRGTFMWHIYYSTP